MYEKKAERRKEHEITHGTVIREVGKMMEADNRDMLYAKNYKEVERLLLYHACPIGAITKALDGCPIVIANSGPSLTDNDIEEIRKRKIPVIAVDNAVKKLNNGGVHPFLIVTVDMQERCSDMIIDGVTKKTFVAVPPWVHRTTMEAAMNGRVLLYSAIPAKKDDFTDKFNRKFPIVTRLSMSATVGTVAFSIAHLLGCRPIIMAGLDLSFENESEVPEGKEVIDLENGRVSILDFLASKLWYELNFGRIKDGIRKIQTSPFMELDGTENMALPDALREKDVQRGKYPNAFWALEKGYNKYKSKKGGI